MSNPNLDVPWWPAGYTQYTLTLAANLVEPLGLEVGKWATVSIPNLFTDKALYVTAIKYVGAQAIIKTDDRPRPN